MFYNTVSVGKENVEVMMSGVPAFADSPEIVYRNEVIGDWRAVQLPDRWRDFGPIPACPLSIIDLIRERLAGVRDCRQRSRLELEVVAWLYDFIRANVKRGRIFDLRQVLQEGRADCLGYAKLLTMLGRLSGLDIGVIEVIIDNAGRYVPHTACLLKLADGRRRFIDLWFGSKNIGHRRLGLRVGWGARWEIRDIDLDSGLEKEVSYLPDRSVNAITLYILGNRHLNRKEFKEAVECYSEAIELYPQNARLFFNRAVAYENLGERAKSEADYARAVRDESSLIRIMAREYNEVSGLINLDDRGITGPERQIYLLFAGFATGKPVPPAKIARRLGISREEIKSMLASVKARLSEN